MKKRPMSKCSKCLTGKRTYELDRREPMCPYIYAYKKGKCLYYMPLSKTKSGFISRLLESLGRE